MLIGTFAYFSKDAWTWTDIIVTFVLIAAFAAFVGAMILIFGLKYL